MSIEAVAWAFKQPITPAAKKFVLVALADNADHYGISFPSYKHLQQKTSLTRPAVINNIKALVKDGIIEKAGRIRGNGSDTSNAYKLPIIEGCIDDHPLSGLFKSGGVNEVYPPVNEVYPPVNEIYPGGKGDIPLEASLNHHLIKREREPLTREEFLRGVSSGFQKGKFSGEFNHLTENEISNQAAECWDRWGDNLKGRDPVLILRTWLRKGMALGTVRTPVKSAKGGNASDGSKSDHSDQWRWLMSQWIEKGVWYGKTPEPGTSGCQVPEAILTEFNQPQQETAHV